MNSVERVQEYCLIEKEPQDDYCPAENWPSSGVIDVKDLSIRYAQDLPDVLKRVSFRCEGGEKVAIGTHLIASSQVVNIEY